MSGPAVNNQCLPISMTVIKYMVCDLQNGGSMTDDLDRKLFIAFGDDYLKDHIFQNEHVFFTIETERSGSTVREKFAYKIPTNQNSEISKYRENISTQSLQLIHLKLSDSIQMPIEPLEKMKASISSALLKRRDPKILPDGQVCPPNLKKVYNTQLARWIVKSNEWSLWEIPKTTRIRGKKQKITGI